MPRTEGAEELRLRAKPSRVTGPAPAFVTVTRTRNRHPHTDVTLWFPLETTPEQITSYDSGEFADIRWWPLTDLHERLATPATDDFEPHLARFLDKLNPPTQA